MVSGAADLFWIHSINMQKVFVFGTLKEDFPNFKVNKGKRIRGDFRTLDAYPLYLVGERYVPWLVLDAGNGYRVRGEVYEVSDEALSEMDELEQVDETDGYTRMILAVRCDDAQHTFNAHVYVKTVDQLSGAQLRQQLEDEYTREHAVFFERRSSW